MSKGLIIIARPDPVTREQWIKHFIDHHNLMPGQPGPDDMRRMSAIQFLQILESHKDMHVHFYTGHEHEKGMTVPGRTK